jgi:hypothetical protein
MMNMIKSIRSASCRQTMISALLLFLVFAASGSVRAQLQTVPIAPRLAPAVQRTTDQAPVVRVASSSRARTRNAALVVAPPVMGDPGGPLVLDLPRGNDRIYENNVARTVDSFSIARPTLPATAPTAPGPGTPAGTFGLPAIPGTPQTPTTEALRAGNINLGALVTWVARHAHAPTIGGSAAPPTHRGSGAVGNAYPISK